MTFVLGLLIGILLGTFLYSFMAVVGKDGYFVADTTDPQKDVYRIELITDLETLQHRKLLIFQVKHRDSH